MFQNFLTEEEKEEIEVRRQRYSEWRRKKVLPVEMEEEEEEEAILSATDHITTTTTIRTTSTTTTATTITDHTRHFDSTEEANLNAAENPPISASTGTRKPQMKIRRKSDGSPEAPEAPEVSSGAPEVSSGERTSSNLLARGSISQVQRPVTFNPLVESPNSTASSSRIIRGSKRAPKVRSVDEIFAEAISEFREQQTESFRNSFAVGRRRSMFGTKLGAESGVLHRDSHSVRKQIQRENEDRRWKYNVEKSAASIERLDSIVSSSSSSDEDLEPTETAESASTMTQDQIHRRKARYHSDIAADVFKLFVCFCLALALASLPLVFLETDNLPEEIRFNISEVNICYWAGSKGLLSPVNPCPYRGYISNDKDGHECLRWKDAIDGGNGLPGVEIDEIRFTGRKDFHFPRAYLKEWREQYYKRDALTPERRELVSDYEHRFCRRLGEDPLTNLASCLTLGEKGEKAKDEIYVKDCWIVPCSVRVAAQCYQTQVQAEGRKSLP